MGTLPTGKALMQGNIAMASAAIEAGCRFYAGYPITPQNEIPEHMSSHMPKSGGVFIQAESEIAAINMVFGAAAAGVRAMTSSSSPGISLMQECISYMAACELPAVIVNVQRGGPGLGNISGAQGDYFQATRGGGHGDYRIPVYSPSSVQEAWELTMRAFDTADKYRTPVMLLADGVIGQMMEPLAMTPYSMPALPPKDWTLTGCEGREPRAIKSLMLGDGELEAHVIRLMEKFERIRADETRFEANNTEDAEVVIVAFGIAARVSLAAMNTLKREGLKVGIFRPITLSPFPASALAALGNGKRKFLAVEFNSGQMIDDVRLALCGKADIELYARPGGVAVTPEEVAARARAALSR